jgi:methyl-CpG-binding domain protein 4
MIAPLRDDLMVQQQLGAEYDPYIHKWRHMVAVIMLNQTGRRPVKTVYPLFILNWPTPEALLYLSEPDEVKDIIWSLGMGTVRENRIRKMTQDYINWDGEDATKLYGIGKYGSDSYEIFFKHNYQSQPTDKELLRYLDEEVFV